MITAICRRILQSPLRDSNSRPLPYHESGDQPLTAANPLQTARIAAAERQAQITVRPGLSLLFGTPAVLRVPISAPEPDDIRACFPDQNAAIAERLNGADS